MLNNIGSLYGMKMYEGTACVVQDGYKERTIEIERGGFWQRLFDPDPTLPLWQKTKKKIVSVPYFKPTAYLIGNAFYYHPALKPQIAAVVNLKADS